MCVDFVEHGNQEHRVKHDTCAECGGDKKIDVLIHIG